MTDGGVARSPHLRPHEKELIGSLVKLFVVAPIMPFIATPLHEFGHYWAATILGIDSYIDGYRVVLANPEQLTSSALGFVYLAGGLTAGSFLVFLFLVMARPYRYGTLPLIAAEFAYAPFDATTAGHALHLAVFSGTCVLIASVYLIRFLREGARLAAQRQVPESPSSRTRVYVDPSGGPSTSSSL